MKSKRALAGILSAILAASAMAVLATGCGENGSNSRKTSGDAPVKIRWYQDLRGIDPETDRIIQKMEEINNVEFEFVASPGGSEEQEQKLMLMVSTGEKLDLVTMLNGIDSTKLQWVEDGVLLAYEDYLTENHPNLKAIVDADIYKYLKIDGKSYFKPLPLEAGNRGYVIKQDWLDKVGLDVPTNLDEYYEVIKAFTYDDPDGNGKDDTYGFFVSEPYGSNAFGYIARSFVNCGCWGGDWVELPDGTVTQFVASDYAREAFRFIKKCYDEGLFNKSFVNEKDAEGKMEDLMVQQKIGMMDVTGVSGLLRRFEDAGMEADLTYLPPLNHADGSQGTLPHSGGSWGYHIIPKTCSNPEKVLDFLEWSLTEEGRTITSYGIEGIHYTSVSEQDGIKVFEVNKEEMSKDWNTADYGYGYPLAWGGPNYSGGYIPMKENGYDFDVAYPKQELWSIPDNLGTPFDDLKVVNAQYAQVFPFQASIDQSITVDQKLIDIEIQGRTKAIVEPAADFDANWDAMLAEWMAAGGKELIERGNAAWEKLK